MVYKKVELERELEEAIHVYENWKSVKNYMHEAGWRVIEVSSTWDINGTKVPMKVVETSKKIWDQYDQIFEDRINWVKDKLDNKDYEVENYKEEQR